MATLHREHWVLIAFVIAAPLLLSTAYFCLPSRAEHLARLERAAKQSRALFVTLAPPERLNASVTSSQEEHQVYKRKYFYVTITQEYDIDGNFTNTRELYEEKLFSLGWKIFDPKVEIISLREYCKAPWMFNLASVADYSKLSEPYHRLRITLTWDQGFRCPFPGNSWQ